MKKIVLGLIIFLFIFSISSCRLKTKEERMGYSKENIKKNYVVKKDDFKKVEIDIEQGIGKLNIKGDSDEILEGNFNFSNEDFNPNVDIKDNGDTKKISIEQASHKSISIPSITNNNEDDYIWDIKLGKDIPIDLDVELGIGDSYIDLRDVYIKDLDMSMGVGNAELNLCGDYKKDVEVNIEGGVGNITIILPKDIYADIKTEKGIGKISASGFKKDGNKYINDVNKDDIKIKMNIESGVGNINLKLK